MLYPVLWKKIFHSLLIIMSLSVNIGFAQSCGCDHVLTGLSKTNVNIINASSFTYSPGDVFCIQADTMAGLRFIGFEGTPSQPLIFKNCDGPVVISETTYSGITFRQSKYLQLTGTGDANSTYGFEVIRTGGGAMGVEVSYLSSDVEIDHIEIGAVGFAGIMAKTDPNCGDTLTWRRNGYVLRNLNIHHNFIHDTGGEGMYLGYTGGYKVVSNKICGGDTVFAHWLENVDVHHNIVENSGWDAIQLNLGQGDCRIRDNFIRNPGVEDETFQNFSMSVGGGIYQIYNNFIFNEPGMPGLGLQLISGESGCLLYNNVMIDLLGHSMFLHSRHEYDDPNMAYGIFNNTIIRPGASAILYNSIITQSYDTNLVGFAQDQVPMFFHNNFISNPVCGYETMGFWKKEPECYFDFNNKSTRDSMFTRISHNIITRQIDTLQLLDTLNQQFFTVNGTSALVDAGLDLTSFGVTFDHENSPRPVNGIFDIGAYEFTPLTFVSDPTSRIRLYPNPTSGEIQIESPSPVRHIHLYDLLGERAQLTIMQNRMDLSSLPAGIYWVRMEMMNGEIVVEKVVKAGE